MSAIIIDAKSLEMYHPEEAGDGSYSKNIVPMDIELSYRTSFTSEHPTETGAKSGPPRTPPGSSWPAAAAGGPGSGPGRPSSPEPVSDRFSCPWPLAGPRGGGSSGSNPHLRVSCDSYDQS